MNGGMMGGGMMGAAVIWSLVVVLLLAVTATAIVLLVRRAGQADPDNQGRHSSTTQEAREILRSRYAKGEIEAEEYRRRYSTLDEPM